jgi:transposase-like protein
MNYIVEPSAMNGLSSVSPDLITAEVRESKPSMRLNLEPPSSEVPAKVRRRKFSGSEKRRILSEADRCTKSGEIGALMRREGVYSSMLTGWRKQRAVAERTALAPKRRGPKVDPAVAQKHRDGQLTRENVRLRRQLQHAHAIIDVQKKLCVLLGLPTVEDLDEKS